MVCIIAYVHGFVQADKQKELEMEVQGDMGSEAESELRAKNAATMFGKITSYSVRTSYS